MPKKPKSFTDMLKGLFIKDGKKSASQPAQKREDENIKQRKPDKKISERKQEKSLSVVKQELPDVRKEPATKKRKLPRSVKKKRGYWKLFFYPLGTIFIVGGMILILLFVVGKDPTVFGLTNEYYSKAKECFDSQDYTAAEDYLGKCLAIDKSNADAIIMLADIYNIQQRYSSEADILKEGISYDANSKNMVFYRRIIKAYVSQNLIREAVTFCSELDPYVTNQLASLRPSNIQSSVDQGVYASSINIKLTPPEASTVYYTLDGTFPDTKNSLVYSEDDGGITINNGTVTLNAVAVNESGLVSNLFSSTYRIYNDNAPYTFKDPKIEAVIRYMLNRSASDNIYFRDLGKITEFTNDTPGVPDDMKIQSLEDLAVLANLRSVRLEGESEISDYTVLNTIPSLSSLSVCSASLSDNALEQIFSITGITELTLINDGIYDLSQITSMQSLNMLDLSDNFIADISPLSSLSGLKSLYVSNNRISDLSALSSISGLLTLDISDNNGITSLTGISLLTKLQSLKISNLPVDTLVPIAAFDKLVFLYADGTKIMSVSPLASCKSLSTLDVSRTAAVDFMYLSSTPIQFITATNCGINDLTSVSALSQLASLDVRGNIIVTVEPLVLCVKLETLNISNNYVTDIAMLLDCPSLTYIECAGCTVPGYVLSKFAAKGVSVVS